MHSKNIVKYILIVSCLFAFYTMQAQPVSCIYIQGDKQVPFYVKLEGQMQPRYGKNYCIIPQLAAGTASIEILFQQNAYLPQHFVVQVPPGGCRAFMLTRKGISFSLFDLEQQFYIPAGNTINDDHVPVVNVSNKYVYTGSEQQQESQPEQVVASTQPVATNTYSNTNADKGATNTTDYNKLYDNKRSSEEETVNSNPRYVPATDKEPKFIDNIELNGERTPSDMYNKDDNDMRQPVNTQATQPQQIKPAPVATQRKPIVNNDCPMAVSDRGFQDIYGKMNNHSETTRLKFLLNKLDNCYSTSQVRMLAKGLNNDPERYAFLKVVYSHVTDQGSFSTLENLLSTREWKDYFRLIMP